MKEEKLLKNWEALKALEEGKTVEYRCNKFDCNNSWWEYIIDNKIEALVDPEYKFRLKPDELPSTLKELEVEKEKESYARQEVVKELKDLLESLKGVHPEYHYEIIVDTLSYYEDGA